MGIAFFDAAEGAEINNPVHAVADNAEPVKAAIAIGFQNGRAAAKDVIIMALYTLSVFDDLDQFIKGVIDITPGRQACA